MDFETVPFLARRAGISPEALVALRGSGSGWVELARRYGVDESVIRNANNIENDIIRIDDELRIPLPSEDAQGRYFARAVRGIRQNAEYAPSYRAILEVVNERGLMPQEIPMIALADS